jgi:hypothetical protein
MRFRPATPVARLSATAGRLGITVLDSTGDASAWPDENVAAIVSFGEQIALAPDLGDRGLRADVLAMALIVAAVMGDCETDHPYAITAPAGHVLIFRTRVPPLPPGPGELATLLARECGRDVASAAFEYSAPDERAGSWESWTTRGRGWRMLQGGRS